jgi:acyl-CoA reductase-like NAD-dependent aldehyde dehydrogenase
MRRMAELQSGRKPVAEDDEVVAGRCAIAGREDVDRALEAAYAARRTAAAVPLEDRRALASAAHRDIARHAAELAELLVAEGHPRRLAAWEIESILEGSGDETMDWCFGQLRQEFRVDGRRILLLRKPDGVVCLNPPQNAAGANASLGISVLLAGNTLVLKAPRTSPLTTMHLYLEIVAPLLEEADVPGGALNVVCGSTKPILRTWLESPLVDDVMFFGDSRVGLEFGLECTARGKKPVLELAGNDGFVVWADAELDSAAAALVESFYGSSQICMVPKYALLHPAVTDDFIELFLEHVRGLRPGYPEDPEVVLSPVLKAGMFDDYLAEARERGAEVIAGGERMDVAGRPAADGPFVQPTVIRVDGIEGARELRCVREETFFPLLPLVVAEVAPPDVLLDRALTFVDSNEYGLRNSLWARDDAVVEAFVGSLRNGGLLKVNDSHLGMAPYLAGHGGTGLTGGPHGELHYPMLRTTHLQGVSVADGA